MKLKPKTGADVSSSVARLCTQSKRFPMVSMIDHNWLISQPIAWCQRAKHHWNSTKCTLATNSLRGWCDVLTVLTWSHMYLLDHSQGVGRGSFWSSARAIPPIEALLASTMDTWPEDTEDELLAANIRKGEQAQALTNKDGEWRKCTADYQRVVVQLCRSVSRCVNGCAGTSPSDALVHYCFCSLWACEGRYFQRCFETHGLSLQP